MKTICPSCNKMVEIEAVCSECGVELSRECTDSGVSEVMINNFHSYYDSHLKREFGLTCPKFHNMKALEAQIDKLKNNISEVKEVATSISDKRLIDLRHVLSDLERLHERIAEKIQEARSETGETPRRNRRRITKKDKIRSLVSKSGMVDGYTMNSTDADREALVT